MLIAKRQQITRLLLHWSARYGSVNSLNREVGVVTRAGDGYAIASNGRIYKAVNGQARFEWMDLDGDGIREEPVMLIEKSQTNSWTFPDDLDNAAWTKTNVTISANAGIAPDGAQTMDKIVEDATNALHQISRATGAHAAATNQGVTFRARAAERSWLLLEENISGSSRRSWVNLADGTIGTKHAAHTISLEPLEGGAYDINFQYTHVSGAVNHTVFLGPATGNNVSTYAGDGISGLYLWGLNFVPNWPYRTSYKPNNTATVADQFNVPFRALPRDMTILMRFIERGTIASASSSPRLFTIGNVSGAAPSIRVIANTTGFYRALWSHINLKNVELTTAPAVTNRVDLRVTLRGDGRLQLHQSINEGAETSTNEETAMELPPAWSDTALHLGGLGSSNVGMIGVRDIKIAAGIQTLAQMRSAF